MPISCFSSASTRASRPGCAPSSFTTLTCVRALVYWSRFALTPPSTLVVSQAKSNEILNHNNRIAQLQSRLEEAKSVTARWEQQWNQLLSTAADKTLVIGQIIMASQNLFTIISRHRRAGHRPELPETAVQLDRIQEFVQDLSDITATAAAAAGVSWPSNTVPAAPS
jgi:hypothetical protein